METEIVRVMTRRKNNGTHKQIDHAFPHQVEIALPDTSIGTRVHEMSDYCRSNQIEHATRGIGRLRVSRGRDGMRWCFRTVEHANTFLRMFGGVKLTRS